MDIDISSVVLSNGYELCVGDSVVVLSRVAMLDVDGGSELVVDDILDNNGRFTVLLDVVGEDGVNVKVTMKKFERLVFDSDMHISICQTD